MNASAIFHTRQYPAKGLSKEIVSTKGKKMLISMKKERELVVLSLAIGSKCMFCAEYHDTAKLILLYCLFLLKRRMMEVRNNEESKKN